MDITFFGAAREVTGSCHVVRAAGSAVALDFGMFQGRRSDADAKNRILPFRVEELNAVVLSHAHIDHSGRLPMLARSGYDGPIYATPATHDLCAIMLSDSAHIQEKDAQYLARRHRPVAAPLYNMRDVARVMGRMICVPYDVPFDVAPGIRGMFVEAGHILGSASVILDCLEGDVKRRLVFSADIGRWGLPIIRDPQPPVGADVVIMESTYGNRDHTSVDQMPDRLAQIVRQTAAKGGRVIIPAFAVGRTQELLYDLHRLTRAKAIPPIPIVLDSPLAIAATTVFATNPEAYDRSEELVNAVDDLFDFERIEFTRDAAASKALNARHGPMIVIAASGMAEAGRILHHLAHGAPDPRNTILIVGFQAEHTLGRRIVERRPMLKIYGEDVPLRARPRHRS
jgi:metallo-beta-lactamase family protein